MFSSNTRVADRRRRRQTILARRRAVLRVAGAILMALAVLPAARPALGDDGTCTVGSDPMGIPDAVVKAFGIGFAVPPCVDSDAPLTVAGDIALTGSPGLQATATVSLYSGSPVTADAIASVAAALQEDMGLPGSYTVHFSLSNILRLEILHDDLWITVVPSTSEVGTEVFHGSYPFAFFNDILREWSVAGTADIDFHVAFSYSSSSASDAQIIPQAGTGPGAGSSHWDTELCGFNTGGAPLDISFLFFPRQQPEAVELPGRVLRPAEHWRTTLGAGGTLSNAFGSLAFRSPAQAQGADTEQVQALRSSLGADLAAQAEIYATLPDGRRFGQFFRAEPASAAQPAGTTAVLLTTHDPSHFRVNVGIAAAADGTVVRLTPLSAAGSALAASHDVSLPVLGANTQINEVAAFFGLPDTPDLVIEVEVISGAAFSYASVVDGHGPYVGTSDPTTQLPVRTGSNSVTLLELGSVHGGNEFSGSAMLHNHDGRSASVRASFTPRGATTPAATTNLSLPAGSTVGWDDVVGELFGRSEEVGTLVFTATNGAHISALGREFAVYRDGQGQVTGTAGQLMPGLTETDLLQPGATAHFLGMREGNGERSHVSVYNPGPGTAAVTVASYSVEDASGVANRQYSVRAGELLRINNTLSSLDPGHAGQERRVTVTTTARVHTLAYRVNANGDPVTLRPFIR